MTFKIVMMRHGESAWNKDNLFCGWVDVELSEKGLQEAHTAGKSIKEEKLQFDIVFTSILRRAMDSADIILVDVYGCDGIPDNLTVLRDWRFNERHYGDLTGHNKADMAQKHGVDQVQIWRRSYDVPPPPMGPEHPFYDAIANNPKFKENIPPELFPARESLKDTVLRVVPCWNEVLVPLICAGKRILIVAHGTSLRALVKHLEGMSDEKITKLNLPTGIPFVYELDENMKPVGMMKFLADEETVKKAIAKVAGIGDKSETK